MQHPAGPSGATPISILARVAAVAAVSGLGILLAVAGIGMVAVPGPSATPVASHPDATVRPAVAPVPSPADEIAPSLATGAAAVIQDPVLVGAGDIGRCDSEDDEATAGLIERLPGIVYTLGDNAYETGSVVEFRECLGSSWGRLRDRIAFPVPGNHDHETDGAAGYLGWYGTAAAPDGTTWYARDVGTWRVIVLDSTCDKVGGCGPDSPQGRWLRDELAANPARCTLAMIHHPRFSSGEHGSSGAVGPLWDALYAAGADVVLSGHEHDYERFAPQDPDGRADPERGITQYIVGTGGAPLRGFGDTVPNSRVRASLAHGVLSLTLRPFGWAFRFDSVDGSFTDQGAGGCH